MFCGVNSGPSLALLPTRTCTPFVCFFNNCCEGVCWMNTPSVTGRKPQVPKTPLEDTMKLASCNVVVLAAIKHWKIDWEEFP